MATIVGHNGHSGHPAPHGSHPHAPHNHPAHHHAAPAHSGHAPHPHPHHKKPARHASHGTRNAMIALVALVVAAGSWYLVAKGGDNLTPEERLVEQMHAAVNGAVATTHDFGGALEVVYGENGLNVTARDVPSKACVSVAWRLARDGVVIVNGTMPMRISAGKLSELCADDKSTVTWVPRAK